MKFHIGFFSFGFRFEIVFSSDFRKPEQPKKNTRPILQRAPSLLSATAEPEVKIKRASVSPGHCRRVLLTSRPSPCPHTLRPTLDQKIAHGPAGPARATPTLLVIHSHGKAGSSLANQEWCERERERDRAQSSAIGFYIM